MLKNYHKHSEQLLEQIPKGVFITVEGEEKPNTMTIAWGHIGVIWGKPVFIAYVRYSRYTYDLLLNAKDFTINVPISNPLKESLKIAGTQSGRDIDKFDVADLTPLPSETVNSPGIKECDLNYECEIIYQQTQEPALISPHIKDRYYKNHDTHIMFYGEIKHMTMKGEPINE